MTASAQQKSSRRFALSLSLLVPALLCTSVTASAAGVGLQIGEHYTRAALGFGEGTPGLYSQLDWSHNDDAGDMAGFTLGLGLPVGPLLFTAGGKALWLHPRGDDDGYGLAVGGGLNWDITQSLSAYGSAYYSPDSLSSGVDHYREMEAGMRWTVVRPVSLSVGYRYTDLAGKHGHRNRKIADGMYVGGNIGF